MDARLLADARLDAGTSLAVFRAALAAASRPGRIERLPERRPPSLPTELLVPLALADLEVSVVVIEDEDEREDDDGDSWTDLVRAATGARSAPSVATADLVVARRTPTPQEVASMRTGDAFTPEHGARLVVRCTALAGGHPAGQPVGQPGGAPVGVTTRLTGPGAMDGRTVWLGGVPPELLDALAAANGRFPAGVDTWFVAPDGSIVAIPRSSTIERPGHGSGDGDD